MSMDGRYLARGRMPVAIFIHPTEKNPLCNQEASEGMCNLCNIRAEYQEQIT